MNGAVRYNLKLGQMIVNKCIVNKWVNSKSHYIKLVLFNQNS